MHIKYDAQLFVTFNIENRRGVDTIFHENKISSNRIGQLIIIVSSPIRL